MRYILLYICACLPIKPGATHAAVTEAWVQRYNAPANGGDRAQALAVDGSGHVVVTGHSQNSSGYSDFYTARYAATNGALLWERRYDAPANRDDLAKAVAVAVDGNVLVTGASHNGTSYDC